MTDIMLPCECGRSVAKKNFEKHLTSSCHQKNLERKRQQFQKGDKYNIVECTCGYVLTKISLRNHLQSTKHFTLIEKKKTEKKFCPECGFGYTYWLAHQQNDEHKRNKYMRERYQEQRRLTPQQMFERHCKEIRKRRQQMEDDIEIKTKPDQQSDDVVIEEKSSKSKSKKKKSSKKSRQSPESVQ